MNEQLVPKCTNNAYQVTVRCDDKQIQFNLVDRVMNFELADGPYFYMARRPGDESWKNKSRCVTPLRLAPLLSASAWPPGQPRWWRCTRSR